MADFFGPKMQIRVLHGLSEKGEQKKLQKCPKIPPINTPLRLGFWLKKKEILAKLWSNFSKEIRPREFKQEQEKIIPNLRICVGEVRI